MDSVNVRNLEEIQEDNRERSSLRLGTWLLLSIAGAALAVTSVTMAKRGGPPSRSEKDPLAELVAKAKLEGKDSPQRLQQRDVSFPAMLSDQDKPTTALAAVRDERGRLLKQEGTEPGALGSAAPPLGSERLAVSPLPVGALLGATSVTKQPKDQLTAMAVAAASADVESETAPPGADSGYQIQVASSKKQEEADALVADLRKRGHRAFRQAAYVQGRGLWHRVRIGPFKSNFEAQQYKKKLEQAERLSPYVIDPFKVEQAEDLRAAKLEARNRKLTPAP